MRFPSSNKKEKPSKVEEMESNAKKLEGRIKKINRKFLAKVYLQMVGLLLITLFGILFVYRFVGLIFDIIYLWL